MERITREAADEGFLVLAQCLKMWQVNTKAKMEPMSSSASHSKEREDGRDGWDSVLVDLNG